jgi:biopolymer transport protein ExbB
MEDIRAIIAAYDDELRAGGMVERRPAALVGLDGRRRQAEVTRIGALTAICRDVDAGLCFAVYGKEHDAFLAVSRVPWLLRRTVKRFLAGKDADVCLDFSGGASVARLALQPTPWERLKSGGVLVWPILFIGIVAVALSIERFFFLRRVKSNTDTVMGTVTGLVADGQWDEGLRLVQQRHGPVYNVLAAGLRARRSTREVLEHVFEEAIMKELPRLERFLPTLQVLAAVAPLLGLLGTVTGMIDTFQVITIFGTGDPKLMSGGISEALVTTKLGLTVAIPIILVHAFFSRRVEAIIGDMEEKAVGLTVAIINRDNGRGC